MSLSKVAIPKLSSAFLPPLASSILSGTQRRLEGVTTRSGTGRRDQRWRSTDQSGGNKKGPRRGRRFLKWALGAVVAGTVGYYGWHFLERVTRPSFPNEPKKKVVILGSGWSAMSVLNHLNPNQFDVTVVSPRNYFLFTPILPSVTVGTVESRSIVEPIRKLIQKAHRNDGVRYYEAECLDVIHKEKKVFCKDTSGIQGSVSGFHLDYDILIVGVGAGVNTFNTPGVNENCFFLKEMEDAHRIRDAVIDLIESASYPGQPEEERKRLLSFVVVGGGPTGVEFASEVRDFLREDIPKIYPRVLDDFKVMLIQSGDHLLNTYDEQISSFTEQNFKKEDNNVSVVTGTRVTEVRPKEIVLLDKITRETYTVPYGLCVWSTGVSPRTITKKLMSDMSQKKGRALLTDSYLRVKGADGIFALGDCSTIEQDKMIYNAEELFKAADINGDGTLSLNEFKLLMLDAKRKYPQVGLFFDRARKNVEKLFQEVDTSGDQVIDLQEFKQMLKTLDGQLKSLPATAQVASQQGKYLGKLLSKTNGNIIVQSPSQLEEQGYRPFEYKHLGSFAYIGDNRAVLEVPILGALNGWWVMWLWRAAYASECASLRTKVLLVTDWIKSYIFGRDTSRI